MKLREPQASLQGNHDSPVSGNYSNQSTGASRKKPGTGNKGIHRTWFPQRHQTPTPSSLTIKQTKSYSTLKKTRGPNTYLKARSPEPRRKLSLGAIQTDTTKGEAYTADRMRKKGHLSTSDRRTKDTREFKIGHYGRLGRLDRCYVTQNTRDLLPLSFWDATFSPGFSS